MLDVSKARHCGRLYQCLTLNFGARASGFCWARVAGLLVRLTHKFWWLSHSALIYVDDILALLEKSFAPLMASLLVVLLQVLRVPMSWRKAKLSARVTWIGWQFDFCTYTVRLEPKAQTPALSAPTMSESAEDFAFAGETDWKTSLAVQPFQTIPTFSGTTARLSTCLSLRKPGFACQLACLRTSGSSLNPGSPLHPLVPASTALHKLWFRRKRT